MNQLGSGVVFICRRERLNVQPTIIEFDTHPGVLVVMQLPIRSRQAKLWLTVAILVIAAVVITLLVLYAGGGSGGGGGGGGY